MMNRKLIPYAVLFLAAFALGVSIDFFILDSQTKSCAGDYKLINTNVVCGGSDIIKKTGYAETVGDISEFIEAEKTKGAVRDVSIYFHDLNHGPTFGIDELADFAPASLIKLPLAMVYFNLAAKQPEIWEGTMQYRGTTAGLNQNFPPRETAEPNQPYTAEDLMELMLVYSDNAAYEVLHTFLTDSPERAKLGHETFSEIGFIEPDSSIDEVISVRRYASLFRILYNASYLNAEDSEKTLSWLAASDFDVGLSAGVPRGTAVANKFGERYTDDGVKQLHDCGIIYYPGNPYLLCVMTRGDDWGKLADTIADISRIVWEEVNSRKL